MRTTLAVDDDVLAAARELARLEGRSLGEVVSELARRGLRPSSSEVEVREGFPVFVVPAGSPPMTMEDVAAALDDE